jgi:dTDP-4-amino-4,6-dideoxygalactose transaminase
MINVTYPYLPDKEKYKKYIDDIWERNWLTNHGPLVILLQEKLQNYLGVKQLLFLGNGTIAIQIAIKALELKGEVITTPFSYVATTSSIVWENCEPVFADIDPDTLNIEPDEVEKKITKNTSAIIATHVYGNPCDVEKLALVAKKYNLKIIYDGAHAFGTQYKGQSIFNYGDISTLSFHATKLFHTIEGGGVVSSNDHLNEKMSHLGNFGHIGFEKFDGVGINGKNSEFHAAMGLCNLEAVDSILDRRKYLSQYYDDKLKGHNLLKPKITPGTTYNYAYYPVIFKSEDELLKIMKRLTDKNIGTRRYFNPSLNTLNYVKNSVCEISEDISRRVLCLPIYHDLNEGDIDSIAANF